MTDPRWPEPDSECIYLPLKVQQPRRPPDEAPRLLLVKDGTGPWRVGDKFWWAEVPKSEDEPEMQGPCFGFPPYSTGRDNATGVKAMMAALQGANKDGTTKDD